MVYNFIRFPGGKPKAVTFSYDDGSSTDIRLVETFNKYGLKCTFNLVGQKIEKGSGLSKDFIKSEILAKGHEIATHGYLHKAPDSIRTIEAIRDTLDTRLILEREFGGIIRGFAFPDRSVHKSATPELYSRVKNYLTELDIVYARTGGEDNDRFSLPDDFYNWAPSAHHDNPKLLEYIDSFLSLDLDKVYRSRRDAKLLYIWGHSHEYESNGNWDRLDTICERLSGKEDVWYATNMEIYEYVTAFRSLIYSADGNTVYNPTLKELWFDVDKTLYHISPGETLTIA